MSRNELNKSEAQESSRDEINIVVTGDYCPHYRIEDLCMSENYEKIYNDALPLLKEKDISITNLECPLTLKKIPIKKSDPHLRAHPKCINAIKYGNFDVVTLANNHILDHGEIGLKDTLKLCQKGGIKTVVVGANLDEASQPLFLNVKNKKMLYLTLLNMNFLLQKNIRLDLIHWI